MQYRYVTADVFSDQPFLGNPVAVVLGAETLSCSHMQNIAREFNYTESVFVLPSDLAGHCARLRIFTPSREIPFAGHPLIGTAFLLAQERQPIDGDIPVLLRFETLAGTVPVALSREGEAVVGGELTAPEQLSRHTTVDPDRAAACVSLLGRDVRTAVHRPQIISVGLPFLVFELASLDALRRARPNPQAFNDLLPLDGATAVYVYAHNPGAGTRGQPELFARMFTPRMSEDAATGSATAATAALLAEVNGVDDITLRVTQGLEIGRASLLTARAVVAEGKVSASVQGHCTKVMSGTIFLRPTPESQSAQRHAPDHRAS